MAETQMTKIDQVKDKILSNIYSILTGMNDGNVTARTNAVETLSRTYSTLHYADDRRSYLSDQIEDLQDSMEILIDNLIDNQNLTN